MEKPRAKPMARPSSPRPMRPDSAPVARPASSSSATPAKKPKAKKPSAKAPPQAPGAGGAVKPRRVADPTLVISNIEQLSEAQAKAQLSELQKKYGALIVNFNNQQAELAKALKAQADLESRCAELEAERGAPPLSADEATAKLQKQLENALGVRRSRLLACLTRLPSPLSRARRSESTPGGVSRALDASAELRRAPQEVRSLEQANMNLQKKFNKLQGTTARRPRE